MKQENWDAMTSAEQADYLSAREITVQTQTFLNGASTVGNAKIVVGRMAVCGGVSLTGWLTDPPETVIAAARSQIEALRHAEA